MAKYGKPLFTTSASTGYRPARVNVFPSAHPGEVYFSARLGYCDIATAMTANQALRLAKQLKASAKVARREAKEN